MNRNFDFSWEFKNFAVHAAHQDSKDKNSPLMKGCPVGLVKYFDDKHKSCYVVAWLQLDDKGYKLHFIGDRPMRDIDADEMKSICSRLQTAQKMLDDYFYACEAQR